MSEINADIVEFYADLVMELDLSLEGQMPHLSVVTSNVGNGNEKFIALETHINDGRLAFIMNDETLYPEIRLYPNVAKEAGMPVAGFSYNGLAACLLNKQEISTVREGFERIKAIVDEYKYYTEFLIIEERAYFDKISNWEALCLDFKCLDTQNKCFIVNNLTTLDCIITNGHPFPVDFEVEYQHTMEAKKLAEICSLGKMQIFVVMDCHKVVAYGQLTAHENQVNIGEFVVFDAQGKIASDNFITAINSGSHPLKMEVKNNEFHPLPVKHSMRLFA